MFFDEDRMTFSTRRKPLAQFFLLGMTGLMTSGQALDVQAEPLRVDPALLGLPPASTVEDEKRGVEVMPVAVPAVPTISSRASDAGEREERGAREEREKTRELDRGRAPVAPATPLRAPIQGETPQGALDKLDASKRPAAGSPSAAVPTAPVAPTTLVPKTPAPADVRPSVSVTPERELPVRSEAREATAALPRVDPAMLGASASSADARIQPTGGTPAAPARAETVAAPSVPAVPDMPPKALVGETRQASDADVRKSSEEGGSWYQRLWAPVSNAYYHGSLELFLPLRTHHLRSKYAAEKIASYQESPLGFGIGSGLYNERGNWEGVYAMAFQDSHSKPMYMAGYGWQSIWRPSENTRLGLGYIAGLVSRSDIWGYKPFPAALPIGSIAYRNFSLNGTFIPGGGGWGNVAFFWAKWELGKPGEKIGTPAQPAAVEPSSNVAMISSASPSPRLPYGPVVSAVSAGGIATTGAGGAEGVGVGGVGGAGGVRGVEGAGGVSVADAPASRVSGASGISGSGSESAGRVSSSDAAGAVSGDASPATMTGSLGASGADGVGSVPDHLPALALRQSGGMAPLPEAADNERPAFLHALRMGGDVDRELNAEGEAELRKAGTVVNADRMTYWPIEDEVEAEGSVRLEQGRDVVTGPKMRLKLEERLGFFERPEFRFKRGPAPGSQAAADIAFAEHYLEQRSQEGWTAGFAMPLMTQDIRNLPRRGRVTSDGRGAAERVDFEGENQYRLTRSTFTTCAPGDDDWYVRSGELKLDYDREIGDTRDATLYFKDMPIFYAPRWSFSLNGQRKSGLLTPSLNTNSTNGITLSVPYYWNIAPNRDATITTRVISKRGVQLDTLARYLDTAFGGRYEGEGRIEFLPNDRLYDSKNRYGLSLAHRQFTANGLVGEVNFNKVSDSNYFTDLSSYITATSQTQLLQQAKIGYYGGGWWDANINFQRYQTLQPDASNPVLEQYRMLPQITVNARRPDLNVADASFLGQYTIFSKPQQVIHGVTINAPKGRRLMLYPQVSVPYVTPGWYVTPKLGLNFRHYSLSNQAADAGRSITSTLPVFSVDSGMTFERDSRWFGKDYQQTLEPRLYYVNIPYRNQDAIPVFDAALADFSFAQIFSENQFAGWDRINNANQLTAALTSRLLEPNSGAEIMRAMIGQRFYFSRNKVGLSANSIAGKDDRNWDRSDLLAAFSGQVLPRIYTDVASQYNLSDRQIKRLSVGVRYLPEPGKVLNAAYRYNRDASAPINQIDLSGQWPLTGRLYAVGRYNYSFKDDGAVLSTASQRGRLIQAVAGLEYRGGCWVLRGVAQRLALTSEKASTGFFVQLELNDFASIGSNPIDMLRRNIQGYSLINEPVTDFNYVQ